MQKLRTPLGATHAKAVPVYSLYRELRGMLGYTQLGCAQRIGITRVAWQRRERKEVYRADELIGLYRMSGLSPTNFLKLLEKCR